MPLSEKEIQELVPNEILEKINNHTDNESVYYIFTNKINKCFPISNSDIKLYFHNLNELERNYTCIIGKKVFIEKTKNMDLTRIDCSKFTLVNRKKDADYIILENDIVYNMSNWDILIPSTKDDVFLLVTGVGYHTPACDLRDILMNYSIKNISSYVNIENKEYFLKKNVILNSILNNYKIDESELNLLEPDIEIVDSIISLLKQRNDQIACALLSQYRLNLIKYPILYKLYHYLHFRKKNTSLNRLFNVLNNTDNIYN